MLLLSPADHWLMVSCCDRWMSVALGSVVCHVSPTIASKGISYLTTIWILTKLGRNDPYMTLFNNCSNGSGRLQTRLHRLKIDFRDKTF